ncbi:histidine kinase [Streptomyces pactum]|uniref:histidine kinase n=1 Tax=Streptomyces pactum TaxID=68249 RepID=UPI0036F4E6E7
MINANVLFEMALGGGLVAASGALVAQARGKQAALRARQAAEAEVSRVRAAAELSVRQVRQAAAEEAEALRRQAATDREWRQAALAETQHLVERRLPRLVDVEARRHPGVEVPGPSQALLRGSPWEDLHQAALDLVREAVETTRASVGRSARAGVRGVADEAQTFLTKLQMKIDEELGKHPHATAYHQSLIEIDHFATRSLHTLQRLRVLAGSWPGTQRANASIREIVESARGRVGPYERVEYTYRPDVGELFVEGRVVEPIVVALAELMINATMYSSDTVSVYAQQVPAGCRIVVEDTGLGMNAFQLADAERLLSSRTLLDVTALEDERKLGFAVIGRLTHDYGFRVDVGAPSASGGVKAVLLVPTALMGEAPERGEASPVPLEEPGPAPAAAAPAAPPAGAPPLTTVSGLPKRQPKQLMTLPPSGPSQEAVTDTADAHDLADGFEQIRRALSTGYAQNDTDTGGFQ